MRFRDTASVPEVNSGQGSSSKRGRSVFASTFGVNAVWLPYAVVESWLSRTGSSRVPIVEFSLFPCRLCHENAVRKCHTTFADDYVVDVIIILCPEAFGRADSKTLLTHFTSTSDTPLSAGESERWSSKFMNFRSLGLVESSSRDNSRQVIRLCCQICVYFDLVKVVKFDRE